MPVAVERRPSRVDRMALGIVWTAMAWPRCTLAVVVILFLAAVAMVVWLLRG